LKIGAHVSTAGGIDKAIDRARDIGAEAVQVFISPPQGWAYKAIPPQTIEAFKAKSAAMGIAPTFFHGVYLVNLATPNQANLAKGLDSLAFYMRTAAELGAPGVIFHVGSHGGEGFEKVVGQIADSIRRVLQNAPAGPWMVLENSAGMGHHVGSKFAELGRILKEVESPRVKICLDTEHSFAAGYNIATKDGLEATFEEFEREIGLSNLVAVHANDAKVPFASGVDRHDNIGEGYIGVQGFENMIRHPAFKETPFFLEVPGYAKTGPDKENVEAIKAIRQRVLGY